MSAQYSQNLRTTYIEASSHIANQISTFRLDKDAVYMPNLRLVNVGYYTNGTDRKANPLVGFLGVIKNIRLMDGAKTLSQQRHCNRWLSFQNQLGRNQHKLCVDSVNTGTAIGYMLQSNDECIHVANGTTVSKNVESEKLCAVLDLRKVFPLLNNLSFVSTSVFKQLRIEVEYESDPVKVGAFNLTESVTVQQPTLVCDMVTDPAISSKIKASQPENATWDEMESDVIVVPANQPLVASGTTKVKQSTTNVINGFDNKYLGRIAILKNSSNPTTDCYTTNVSLGFGTYASRNYGGERLQIRKNGTNLFGGNGISNNSYRTLLLYSSWGDMCVPPFATRGGVGLDNPNSAPVNKSGQHLGDGTLQNARVGGSDYYGVSIEDRVNQLVIEFDRDVVYSDANFLSQTSSVDLYIFGECRKQIIFKDGSYDCYYV